jgi:GTP-binding protein
MQRSDVRNIAIVAHVDHGKTTLVDGLLKQAGAFRRGEVVQECALDSNPLERERGITILAKNTAITWNGVRINIVDTPGHADFGGEVERVLRMVDSVLLLVDAYEGPMPQTRFVTKKALELGLKPIVVVNKIDREGCDPHGTVDGVFDLFVALGATDAQLDFPVIYASGRNGYAIANPGDDPSRGLAPLLDMIVDRVPAPECNPDGPLCMHVATLDYDDYLGYVAVGRISDGKVKMGDRVLLAHRDGKNEEFRVQKVLASQGLKRFEIAEGIAGDIVAVTGMEELNVGETITSIESPKILPLLTIDEPTISMQFIANDGPFSGQEGKYVTTRNLRERLQKEVKSNVALRVEDTEQPNIFKVSGRGELHLSVLIETMRREGYELAVSRAEVIIKEIDGVLSEPFEQLVCDMEEAYQGGVMERLGSRRGQLTNMEPDGKGRVRLDYMIPARGLIGFQTEFRTITAGTGLLFHVFDHYGPKSEGAIAKRQNGVMISNGQGPSPAYSLVSLQERGRLLISEGDNIYEGQLVGIHSKDNDLTVNALRAKQMTNIRAAGKDETVQLTPPIKMSLEQALEFIEEDELVEVTPKAIRLRKKHLTENDRKRASRQAA